MIYFVDTSAFVALGNRDDQWHGAAEKFNRNLHSRDRFITTNYVVDETITRIRMTAGLKSALDFGKSLFSSKIIQITYVDENLERLAFELLKKYQEHPLSFTDCTSFALMSALGIKAAFTIDQHFRKVGFQVFP
ncbi:MAG: PIN domain-containing protein [bacterium]